MLFGLNYNPEVFSITLREFKVERNHVVESRLSHMSAAVMCHRGSNKLEFSFLSQVSCIMYLPLTTRAVVLFVFSLINTVIVNLQWLTFKYALYHRSHLSSFSLHPLSLSLHPAAPKVERLDDNSCEVTWEALQPMKGDPILYALQCMMGNSDFKQVLTLFWVCFFFYPRLTCHSSHCPFFIQIRIQMDAEPPLMFLPWLCSVLY